MKTMLRVFWSLCELKDTNGTHYVRTKKQSDFPVDVVPEAAYAEIHHKFGQLGVNNRKDEFGNAILAPLSYADISSHTVVDVDRETVELPTEKFLEMALGFDPLDMKACLQDSPDLKAKKMKQNLKRDRS